MTKLNTIDPVADIPAPDPTPPAPPAPPTDPTPPAPPGEMLAWQASKGEIGSNQQAYTGEQIDPLMTTFFQGTYLPSCEEISELASIGVDATRLLVMNPTYVFRHTLTKPDYERHAEIRLKSCFALQDLKRQLMQSDRASLIGAANYILLIRKGEKDAPPALPE